MIAPTIRVERANENLRRLRPDIGRALDHIQRELANCDWHPADTSLDSGPSGSSTPTSPAERIAIVLSELTSRRHDIIDWIDGLEGYLRSGRFLVDDVLRIRTPAPDGTTVTSDLATPCRYRYVDPRDERVTLACTNWASVHLLHGTGTETTEWCDDHWPLACQIHGDHLHEERRVDGVLCCQRAYRQHRREAEAHAA